MTKIDSLDERRHFREIQKHFTDDLRKFADENLFQKEHPKKRMLLIRSFLRSIASVRSDTSTAFHMGMVFALKHPDNREYLENLAKDWLKIEL